MNFINAERHRFGVEPICQVLEIAPSTYYAASSRAPSARQLRDEELKAAVARVHKDNFGVYGVEKVWRQLHREGVDIGRDRVARLMQEMNIEGVRRGKKRTTIPAEVGERLADLVDRKFEATAPNRLWVADLERHEALCNRAEMQELRCQTLSQQVVKLGAAQPWRCRSGWQAAPTTP